MSQGAQAKPISFSGISKKRPGGFQRPIDLADDAMFHDPERSPRGFEQK